MDVWQIAHVIARVLFSALFIMSGVNHLTRTKQMAEYAKTVGKVPAPAAAVVVTGLMILVGGISTLAGYHPRIGALLIFVFLLLAAFWMHQYWKIQDPMQKVTESAHFWKDISLAGAALFIAADPNWPWPSALGNLFQ